MSLTQRTRNIPVSKEPSDSSDESSESEEIIAPLKSNGVKMKPSMSVNTIASGQVSLSDKLMKIEQLLIKFNGSDKIPILIDAFTKNIKLLEGLKIKNLDELRHLEKLNQLDGLSKVYEGLDNIKFLKELERLNDLEYLENLNKLDIFNDDRINQLFINIDQINNKLLDFTSHGLAATNEKLNAVSSKIDILNLSLKPFRETNYANKMLELPIKLGVELTRIAEHNKISIKDDVITVLEEINKNIKDLGTVSKDSDDISQIELIKLISNIKESLAYITRNLEDSKNNDDKNVALINEKLNEVNTRILDLKLSGKSSEEFQLIKDSVNNLKKEIITLFKDDKPDDKSLNNITNNLSIVKGNLDTLIKNNVKLSDLSIVEDNLSKKIIHLGNSGNVEKLINMTSSNIEESIELLKQQVISSQNMIIEKIDFSNIELGNIFKSELSNIDSLGVSIQDLGKHIQDLNNESYPTNTNDEITNKLQNIENKIEEIYKYKDQTKDNNLVQIINLINSKIDELGHKDNGVNVISNKLENIGNLIDELCDKTNDTYTYKINREIIMANNLELANNKIDKLYNKINSNDEKINNKDDIINILDIISHKVDKLNEPIKNLNNDNPNILNNIEKNIENFINSEIERNEYNNIGVVINDVKTQLEILNKISDTSKSELLDGINQLHIFNKLSEIQKLEEFHKIHIKLDELDKINVKLDGLDGLDKINVKLDGLDQLDKIYTKLDQLDKINVKLDGLDQLDKIHTKLDQLDKINVKLDELNNKTFESNVSDKINNKLNILTKLDRLDELIKLDKIDQLDNWNEKLNSIEKLNKLDQLDEINNKLINMEKLNKLDNLDEINSKLINLESLTKLDQLDEINNKLVRIGTSNQLDTLNTETMFNNIISKLDMQKTVKDSNNDDSIKYDELSQKIVQNVVQKIQNEGHDIKLDKLADKVDILLDKMNAKLDGVVSVSSNTNEIIEQLQSIQKTNNNDVNILYQKLGNLDSSLNDIRVNNNTLIKSIEDMKNSYDITPVINTSVDSIKNTLVIKDDTGNKVLEEQFKKLNDKVDNMNTLFTQMSMWLNTVIKSLNEKLK